MYDTDGHRVQKGTMQDGFCVATAVYVYDVFGHMAAEYSGGNTAPCTTCYLSYDHLGSVRLVTNQSGIVVSRHEYIPFGEEIPGGWAGRSGSGWGTFDNVNQCFTGKERDAEAGLDYFGARYYGSVLGRFTSPDPVGITTQKLLDPQQWNVYAYVRNNPLSLSDPTGLYVCQGILAECKQVADNPKGTVDGSNVPAIGPLPKTQGTAIGERLVGALKGFLSGVLELGQTLTGELPDSEASRLMTALRPTTQDEKFGGQVADILTLLIPGEGPAEEIYKSDEATGQ